MAVALRTTRLRDLTWELVIRTILLAVLCSIIQTITPAPAQAASTITVLNSGFTWLGPKNATLSNTSGWTQIVTQSFDDEFQYLSLGSSFNFSFENSTYNCIEIHSNTYLAFQTSCTTDPVDQTNNYSDFSGITPSNPAKKAIHMCSKDNSYQKVFYRYDNANTKLRIRYEGNNTTSGTVGSPTIVYEAVFTQNSGVIDIGMGINSSCDQNSGLLGVTTGTDNTWEGTWPSPQATYNSGTYTILTATGVKNNDYRITSGPTVSTFSSTQSTPTNTIASITYSLVMSEAVTNMGNDDFENAGTATGCTFVVSGSGTTYTLTVSNCSEGTLLPRLKANSVTGVSVGPSSASPASTTITLDRTAPAITSITAPASSTYGPAGNLDFPVVFSESVTITGTPRIPLTVGSTQRYATFSSMTDSRTATFRYTVQTSASDIDTDGVTIASPLELNGGAIADPATNAISNLTFSSPSLLGVKVAQRAAAPTITSITPSNATLSVAFAAGNDNGSTITSYEYSTDNGATWKARASGTTASPITITQISSAATNLVNATTYQVRIRALSSLNGSSTGGDSSTAVSGTPTSVPVVSVSPSISGTVSIGSRLTATTGTWSNSPTSYTYRWVRSQSLNGTYATIAGATSDSYTVVSGDNSFFIRVVVTATNASGSASDTSAATTQVKVPISISGGSNISTNLGTAASSSAFTASGGYGSLTLSITPVDPQISLSGGVISASSALPAGTYTQPITATDSLGDTATTNMSITVLSVISAPTFTVAKGTLPGAFKLNFSPVTGATSYTVKVYKSNDSYASPFVTVTNYSSGDDIQDGNPRTCGNSSTPICYGIAVGHTFKFTITPVAGAGYTSAGEGEKSGKFAMFYPYGAGTTAPRDGVVGLDVIDLYSNKNLGKSGIIAYIYSSANSYASVFETASIVGTSWNRIALPSGDSYSVTLRHLGATVGDTVWLDSDESAKPTGMFVWNKPNAPSSITAERIGSGSIRISWTRASGPYQAYYYATSTDGSTWTSRGNTTSDSATISSLTNGTPIYVRVYNYGSGTYERTSDYTVMSGTITPAGPPGPVATGSSSPGNASIVLGWTAPSDNGGSAVTGYLIEYSPGAATYTESITALSSDTRITLTGLTNGTSYYVRIKAVNAVGPGTAVDFGGGSAILVKGIAGSTVGAVTSITRTTATISATINARGNTTIPTLTWGLVDGSQTDVTLSSVSSDNVSVTSNLTGLLPGRRYRVTSSVDPGMSQDVGGRPIYFTTTPDSVTGVSYLTTTSSVTVSWTYDSGGNGYGFSYDASASLNGNPVGAGCANVTAASGGRSSCQFTGLTANTAYTFSITKSITGGDYGNGTSEAYTLIASTDPNIATISLNINGGSTNLQFGSTVNIVATTNVAGKVTFRVNGRAIKGCAQKNTISLQALCAWKPSLRGTAQISALFDPTSNLYTNVTSNPTPILLARRTGARE